MDISDPLGASASLPRHVQPLAGELWPKHVERSRELTPLYVQRYAGPRLSTHSTSHAFWELTFVFAGQGRLTGDSPRAMHKNRCLIIPPHVEHGEWADQSVDTLWIGFSGRHTRRWVGDHVRAIDDAGLAWLVEEIWSLTRTSRRGIGPELEGWLKLILARVTEPAQEGRGDWATRLLAYMHRHLHERLTVPAMAAVMGCSEGYLHRRCRKEIGQTPARCLRRMRIDNATELLQQTSLSIREVGVRCGFPDPLHFSREYRRTMGRPPSEARQMLQAARCRSSVVRPAS